MSRSGKLIRGTTGDEGTFGIFVLDDGTTWRSGELPWRDNQHGLSCIPAGHYTAKWQLSPKHGWCYHLQAVPDRADVEIHSANWMGDKNKGYKCQLEGCIALGAMVGVLEGQKAILSSRAAITEFHEKMAGQDLDLIIVGIQEEYAADPGGEISGADG